MRMKSQLIAKPGASKEVSAWFGRIGLPMLIALQS